MKENKPWELTDGKIDELTSDCYGKNITQGSQVAHEAQRKLLEYIKLHDKSLDELYTTLQVLYKDFDIK